MAESGLPPGPANVDLLHFLVRDYADPSREPEAAGTVVETGVAAGWSSFAILLALEGTGARLWSTDLAYPYIPGAAAWVGVAVPERLRGEWTLTRGPDREVLPAILSECGPVDLAHYDSDKSYSGALWAYGCLWDALRSGGLLIADDIGDHLAFRDFSDRVGVHPTVIRDGNKFQGLLVKP